MKFGLMEWTVLSYGLVLLSWLIGRGRTVMFVSALGLLCVPFVLSDTPFRGEHWAMLYVFSKSPTLGVKLERLINMELFGDHRFQPLNSVPMMLSYLAGGFHFAAHYLISVALHLFFVTAALQWLFLMKFGRLGKVREIYASHPLEAALLFVLFVACDVVTWTFFQYIQIAVSLALLSISLYFAHWNETGPRKFIPYALLFTAILIYEPLVVILGLFVLGRLVTGKKGWQEAGLGILILVFFASRYWGAPLGKAITVPGNVSRLNGILLITGHDALFEAPFAFNKVIFVLYNYVLAVCNLALAIIWPTEANKVNLYELPNLQALFGASLPYVSALIFALIISLGAGVYIQKRALGRVFYHYLFAFLAFSGIFTVICLGRPEAGHYSAVQFRYAFVLSTFFLLPLLDLFYRLNPVSKRWIYSALVLFLIGSNLASSLNQVLRLRKDFHTLSSYVRDLKIQGLTDEQIALTTSHTLHDFALAVPGDDVFLIYNGRGALTKFVGKI
jgi:hypothetical protein